VPAKWGRPIDRVIGKHGWSSGATAFDLQGLDAATASGVLTQWVLAVHIRTALIANRHRSVRAFAKKHSLSEDRLNNFLNGNRIARFEDLSVLLELLGVGAWPNPDWVSQMVAKARVRKPVFDKVPSGVTQRYLPGQPSVLDMFAEASAASGSSELDGMNVTHPDSRAINARFRKWVVAQPAVRAHLELDEGAKPTFEVRAVVCDPGEAGCEVWVGAETIAGILWVPSDWRDQVAALGTKAFVLETRPGADGAVVVCAAQVRVSEDGPVEGDVSVVAASGVMAGGEVRWG
jgi:hypothetical protein